MCDSPPFKCLVVCPLSIVAEDLAEVIRERVGPDAAEIFLDPAPALERMTQLPGRLVVFAAIRAQAMARTGFDRAVADRGAQLVLVGTSLAPEEAATRGWRLLPEPFSSEMVEDVLTDLGA